MKLPIERSTPAMPGLPEPPLQGPPVPEDPGIEALLQAYAAREPLPGGLTGRVYRASVDHLAGRRTRPGTFRLPAVPFMAQWGRLALAASIALAFVVALRVMRVPPDRDSLAPSVELAWADSVDSGEADVAALFRPEDARFGAVEQLLLTSDMTFRDLSGDLARLAHDLEM